MDIFYQKVKRRLKRVYMDLMAPLAVHFGVNWPQAYYFAAQKDHRKYKKAISQKNFNRKFLEKVEDRIVSCLDKYIAHKPDLEGISDWVNANILLFTFSIKRGQFRKDTYEEAARVVRSVIERHQLDQLGLEFIPRGFAVGSIGVWENVEAYIKAGILGMRPFKKLILLIDPRSPVNNPCYLNYWQNYVTVISDPAAIRFFSQLERSLTVPMALYMNFHDRTLSSPIALGQVRERWTSEGRAPLLTLSEGDFKRGRECLRSLGVPEDAWFVCLHVREPGWRDYGTRAANFRNCNINTYSSAIKAVVDAGGWVIRMGDPGMTPLPQMDHVLDYAHSSAKSDWMDVFLCAQCRFVIGTASGVYTIATAFGRPVVMTNLLPAEAMYQLSSSDIFIPRICRDKNKGRILDFHELLFFPVSTANIQNLYDRLGLEIIENTPEEIQDAVTEMLERANGAFQYSEEDEHLQSRFRSLTEHCGKQYGDHGIKVNARIARKFLRQYAHLLSCGKSGHVSTGV